MQQVFHPNEKKFLSNIMVHAFEWISCT